MTNKFIQSSIIVVFTFSLFISYKPIEPDVSDIEPKIISGACEMAPNIECLPLPYVAPDIEIVEEFTDERQSDVFRYYISKGYDEERFYDDLEWLALVTMAEAEGEPEEGQRLVIDTVLNRMYSDKYPSTIYGVISQPHQFTSYSNGRMNRVEPTDRIYELVIEEVIQPTNTALIFFNTQQFRNNGEGRIVVGAHYFCPEY